MTKEEETPACASRFTRLKDLVTVGAWVERLLDLFEVDVVHGTHPLEDTRGESGDLGAWQANSTFQIHWSLGLCDAAHQVTCAAALALSRICHHALIVSD